MNSQQIKNLGVSLSKKTGDAYQQIAQSTIASLVQDYRAQLWTARIDASSEEPVGCLCVLTINRDFGLFFDCEVQALTYLDILDSVGLPKSFQNLLDLALIIDALEYLKDT